MRTDFVHDYAQGDLPKTLERIDQRVAQIDWRNEEHVKQAVADLRNDEQIDAAVQVGLFAFAFCFNNRHENTRSIEQEEYLAEPFFQFGSQPPQPPFTYKIPSRRVYEIGEICAVGCEEGCHGDGCYRLHADQAIESVMLERLISTANTMAEPTGIESIIGLPYVLDIDLDYFRSIKSLSPEDTTVFYNLIRNAAAITIATEPNFIKSLRIDEGLTSEYALRAVLDHINRAL